MDCRLCGGALAPGTDSCQHCGAERPAGDAEPETAGADPLSPPGVGAVDAALDWAWLFDTGQGDFAAASAHVVERRRLDVLPDGDSVDFTEGTQRRGTRTGTTGWVRRADAARPLVTAPRELLTGDYLYYLVSMTATWRTLLLSTAEHLPEEQYNDLTGWSIRRAPASRTPPTQRVVRSPACTPT